MGNAHNPELVGMKGFDEDDKWKLPAVTLTQKDLTEALDSLDEGYTSFSGRFEPFKSLEEDE